LNVVGSSGILNAMESSAVSYDPLEISLREHTQHGPFLIENEEIERIAAELHRSAPQGTAESLAAAVGCAIRHKPDLPSELESALLANGTILVRAGEEPRRVELAAFHELAHWVLRKTECSLSDIWRLTLALAVPLHSARDPEASLVPDWAVRARLATSVARSRSSVKIER
jgi:hypothetical protein